MTEPVIKDEAELREAREALEDRKRCYADECEEMGERFTATVTRLREERDAARSIIDHVKCHIEGSPFSRDALRFVQKIYDMLADAEGDKLIARLTEERDAAREEVARLRELLRGLETRGAICSPECPISETIGTEELAQGEEIMAGTEE